MPSVLAVLTGADVTADGLKPLPHARADEAAGRHPAAQPRRLGRASPRRRCCRPTACATSASRSSWWWRESVAAAKDAAERVVVDYEPLDPVVATPVTAQLGAPQLYDHCSNVCIDADVGNVEATKAAFARAAHVVKFDTWVQRVTGVPLDARAAVGVYDPAADKYTLHAGSGGVVRQKGELAGTLGVPPKCRVECGDVGGNFGTRNAFYPEFALVVWAAKRVGRPVKWTCERSEAFASDYQGRDQAITAELALDERAVSLRCAAR